MTARGARLVREHGTLSMYRYCKCDRCRATMAEYNRAYKAKRRGEGFEREVKRLFDKVG